jgi:hypothetical protein
VPVDSERQPIGPNIDVGGSQLRALPHPVGEDGQCGADLGDKPLPFRQVDVHRGAVGHLRPEEPSLGPVVLLDGPVVVEMVLGEVREHRADEPDAAHPVLIESVRRDLHGHRAHSAVQHSGEETMDVGGFRGGSLDRNGNAVHPGSGGADDPRHQPRRPEHFLQDVGGRGLPVGAGDADKSHLFGRLAVEHGCHRTHGPSHRWHHDLGHVGGKLEPPLREHRDRSAGRGSLREVVSVQLRAGDAEEQCARRGFG